MRAKINPFCGVINFKTVNLCDCADQHVMLKDVRWKNYPNRIK